MNEVFGIRKDLYDRMFLSGPYPDWDQKYLDINRYDHWRYEQIFNTQKDFTKIAQFKMMGLDNSAFLSTLLEDANLTCFRFYPNDIILHQYNDRNKKTGPLFVSIDTKHSWNGAMFGDMFSIDRASGKVSLDKYDIRLIEPGVDTEIVPLIDNLSDRLGGILGLIENVAISGHGNQYEIELKTKKKKDSPVANPYAIDLTDQDILDGIKKYLIPSGATFILEACSTGESGDDSLAYFLATYLHARVFAASKETYGIKSITYDPQNPTQIAGVTFGGAETVMYDFRGTTDVQESDWTTTRAQKIAYPNPTSDIVHVPISKKSGETTTIRVYDSTGHLVGRMDDTEMQSMRQTDINLKTYSQTPGLYLIDVEYSSPAGIRRESQKVILSE